jgi:hypothetical protein
VLLDWRSLVEIPPFDWARPPIDLVRSGPSHPVADLVGPLVSVEIAPLLAWTPTLRDPLPLSRRSDPGSLVTGLADATDASATWRPVLADLVRLRAVPALPLAAVAPLLPLVTVDPATLTWQGSTPLLVRRPLDQVARTEVWEVAATLASTTGAAVAFTAALGTDHTGCSVTGGL